MSSSAELRTLYSAGGNERAAIVGTPPLATRTRPTAICTTASTPGPARNIAMPTRVRGPSDYGDQESPSPSPSPARRNLAMRHAKRKRADTANGHANQRPRTAQPDGDGDDDPDEDVYDPDQSVEERRTVQKGYRDLLRDITENGEEYLDKDSNGLHETILKADALSKKLRQTTEATIDSRLLVSTTDLSYRKTLRLTQGSLSQGIDVDEFVSKCIAYMRNGGGISDDDAPELSSTQRQRRTTRGRGGADDDDEIGDEGDMMNWPHLGRFACLPHIRRPALPGFLLGPLSVEKKARKITKRSAPFRPDNLTETRPEVLNVEDLAKRDNDLTAICGKILQQLRKIQADTQETVAELMDDDMDDEEKTNIMHRHGLRSTGGIDLMRFVVNPKSFAQTVENIFYVSFLIRDGRIEIDFDEFHLPALAPVDREADEDGTVRHSASKHQAVLSMDMKMWREIIDVFDLKESMIEHRREATSGGPGARGWYS
ncbi:Non-structural maintenance of chromosome element 4 [Tolypocladium capitatum]|uniref:Non-structural maintenance of chromosomes element 4 n=1 Tax=Tolypocladium capitatum TaxID=45235 RepID=A0A2K3QG88_9HYPO|nr:Non-structural maintenance of chromosome element 4 [Tolypocladium capitatum]